MTTSVRNGVPARRAELREFLMSRRVSPKFEVTQLRADAERDGVAV